MAGLNYKMKKMMLFGMASFIPGLLFIILSLLEFPIMLSITFMLLGSFFFMILGHIGSSQNPFVRAIQDGKVLIMDVPSTGIANIYCATVKETDMNGIDICMDNGETRAYDRGVTNLLAQPQRALMTFFKNKSDPMQSKIEIKLSNDEYKNAAWRYDNLTLLFYNSQTGTLLTKPLMSAQEKDLLAEYLSLNEARELRQLNKALLQLMRYTFDLIGDRISKIFKNPVFILALVVMGLIVVGFLAMQFMPGGTEMINSGVNAMTGVAEPLTKGADAVVGVV